MTGPEHPPVATASLLSMAATAAAANATPAPATKSASTTSGSRSPIAAELRTAESLDEFHALVRRHQVDKVYLDLLEITTPPAPDAYCVILSASRGGTDLLACLPWRPDASRPGADALTYRNVLRSRFLFLGYSVSDGLAAARLARHLPVAETTIAAKSA